MSEIFTANEANRAEVLELLRMDPLSSGLPLQDMIRWPQGSKFYFTKNPFSYLHFSGHPAYAGRGSSVISFGGDPAQTPALLMFARPNAPFVARECGAEFTDALRSYYPDAAIKEEIRMDVDRTSFKKFQHDQSRPLSEHDAGLLAEFFGAPPQAAPQFKNWLNGARAFHGVFESDRLTAIGSSFISLPETWNLVSIETHKDFRGRGFATQVVSSLVTRALEETKVVTVTVMSDNAAAIKTYAKLGFRKTQDRIWADCGVDSKHE
jgi:ribosomal protein S18 acetylase RimI-like enzyme